MNAPRMTSSPSDSASAAKPTSSTSAPRTRICAVVSCRRRRSSRMRLECSAPRTASEHRRGEREQPPSSSSVAPVPPSPEKKIESRMIAPKSAIDAAAMISWPNVVRDLAGVLEHRHEHAERRRAQDDRDEQRRVDETGRLQAERDDERDRERDREAERGQPAARARAAWRTRSRGRRGRARTRGRAARPPRPPRRPRPSRARTGRSTIPATISSTTDGSSTRGKRPSRSGAANATAMTMRRLLKEGMAA